MNTTADPYATLGVSRDADQDAVTDAYRALMRKHHPDMPGGDADTASRIASAYELLTDTGRRAAYDLDSRRGPVTTDGPSTSSSRGTPTPQEGPIGFRVFRRKDWVAMALAAVLTVAAPFVSPDFIPVFLVTLLAGAVATYVAVKGQVRLHPGFGVVPAAAMVTSTDPISRWLGVGVWPLVGFTLLALIFTVAVALYRARKMAKLVGVTQEKRWIFTTGTRAHDFLLSAGNATGWIGMTGDGPFGTMLMSGKNIILLATANPTYPGETLAMNFGQLMRTRPGSTMALPDANIDLPVSLPTIPKGFTGRAAVFVPGVAAGAGPLGDVPVIGEADSTLR